MIAGVLSRLRSADDAEIPGFHRAIIRRDSRLGEDLGMDEVDVIAILCRAEEAFAIVLPDHQIDLSSTVADVVTLVAARLEEKQASLASCIAPTQTATCGRGSGPSM